MKNRMILSLLFLSILTASIYPNNDQPSVGNAISAYVRPMALVRSLGMSTYGAGLAAYGTQLGARAAGIATTYIQPNVASWYDTIANFGTPAAPSFMDVMWQGHDVAKSWIPLPTWNPLSFTLPGSPTFAIDPSVLTMASAGVGCACLGTLLAYMGAKQAHQIWTQMKQPLVKPA